MKGSKIQFPTTDYQRFGKCQQFCFNELFSDYVNLKSFEMTNFVTAHLASVRLENRAADLTYRTSQGGDAATCS